MKGLCVGVAVDRQLHGLNTICRPCCTASVCQLPYGWRRGRQQELWIQQCWVVGLFSTAPDAAAPDTARRGVVACTLRSHRMLRGSPVNAFPPVTLTRRKVLLLHAPVHVRMTRLAWRVGYIMSRPASHVQHPPNLTECQPSGYDVTELAASTPW